MKNPTALLATIGQHLFLMAILIMGFTQIAFAQEVAVAKNYVEITLYEGSTIYGELIEETGDQLIILNPTLEETTIPKTRIANFKKLPPGSLTNGVFWHSNPNSTRGIYTPNGYN